MGTFPNPPIVSGTPADGDVVAWNAAIGEWVPVAQHAAALGNGLWRLPLAAFGPPKASVGTWGLFSNYAGASNILHGGFKYNTSNSVGDRLDFEVQPDAGTWELWVLSWDSIERGIVTVSLDDGAGAFTVLGTLNCFAGGATPNVEHVISGIDVAAGAVARTLRFEVTGKDPASVGFYFSFEEILLHRVA